jgi:tellurite resistance protein TerC
VLRGIFIALGAAALNRFGWILYLFGAFLLYTAAKMAFGRRPDGEAARDTALLRAARRILPVAPAGDGARLTTRISGLRYATPFLVLIIAIAVTDLAFAFDRSRDLGPTLIRTWPSPRPCSPCLASATSTS